MCARPQLASTEVTAVKTWWVGARPRTLPAAIAPVAVGAGAAAMQSARDYRSQDFLIAGLCLIVSLALQVGVNYANDYSDGVKGTDDERVGPVRLVGSGLVAPHLVRRAAFVSFGVAAVAGLVLLAITGLWWLLPVGLLAVAAAWFYTGGARPYGYAGLGEVVVFVFFGVVAVAGTSTLLLGQVTVVSLVASVPVGLLACALLVVNNLRDIASDDAAGKHTLAVRLGDQRTRSLYVAMIWLPFLIVIAMTLVALVISNGPIFAALPIITLPLAAAPARAVRNGATGPNLIAVLGATARLHLVFSLLLAVGLALSVQ